MILITGATGTNGIEIVTSLSRSRVPCRALVRNQQKAAALSDLPGVEIVTAKNRQRSTNLRGSMLLIFEGSKVHLPWALDYRRLVDSKRNG